MSMISAWLAELEHGPEDIPETPSPSASVMTVDTDTDGEDSSTALYDDVQF